MIKTTYPFKCYIIKDAEGYKIKVGNQISSDIFICYNDAVDQLSKRLIDFMKVFKAQLT